MGYIAKCITNIVLAQWNLTLMLDSVKLKALEHDSLAFGNEGCEDNGVICSDALRFLREDNCTFAPVVSGLPFRPATFLHS